MAEAEIAGLGPGGEVEDEVERSRGERVQRPVTRKVRRSGGRRDHLLTPFAEPADERGAKESGCAGDEHVHGQASAGLTGK